MKVTIVLEGTYYGGSMIYTLNYIDRLCIDELIICSPFNDSNSDLSKKYNIKDYDNEYLKCDILLINCVYCFKVFADLEKMKVKPQKIITTYQHVKYDTFNQVHMELTNRGFNGTMEYLKELINLTSDMVFPTSVSTPIFNWYTGEKHILPAPALKRDLTTKNNIRSVFRFLCVGTLCDRKNQLLLLETFSNLKFKKKVELYVVGLEENHPAGYYKGYNKKCLEYASDNIKIIPACDSSDYYNMCDCFVFCSKAETDPLVIPEALSYGLPVITSNCGGNYICNINDDNGYVYNTVEELEKYMLEVVNKKYNTSKIVKSINT